MVRASLGTVTARIAQLMMMLISTLTMAGESESKNATRYIKTKICKIFVDRQSQVFFLFNFVEQSRQLR
jgi:hypothetical protein